MQSPFTIGVLSIIPGLGFFVLGQLKRGVGIIGTLIGLFTFSLFIPSEFLSELSFQLFLITWIGQIYYAVQTAKLLKKQKSGEIIAPRETRPIAPAPHGSSANEKLAHKVRETVRQQLDIGEHLIDAVFAQVLPSMGAHILVGAAATFSTKSYYVGLTEKTLIMLEQDFMGKPINVKRISLSDLKSSEYKKGLLTDSLELGFGNKKSMKLRITVRLRTQVQTIFTNLQNQNAD